MDREMSAVAAVIDSMEADMQRSYEAELRARFDVPAGFTLLLDNYLDEHVRGDSSSGFWEAPTAILNTADGPVSVTPTWHSAEGLIFRMVDEDQNGTYLPAPVARCLASLILSNTGPF